MFIRLCPLLILFFIFGCQVSKVEESPVSGGGTTYKIDLPVGNDSTTMNISSGVTNLSLNSTCNFTQSFNITVNGSPAGTANCDGSNYNLTVSSTYFNEGVNPVVFSATVGATTITVNYTVRVDTIQPLLTINALSAIDATNFASYPLSGTCSEEAKSVNLNVAGLLTAANCSGGVWSASVNTTIVSDGPSISITANHSDAANNPATEAAGSVIKDTIIPVVDISIFGHITLANQSAYSFSGTCSEAGRDVSLSVGTVTATVTCTAGTWDSGSLNVSSLSDSSSVQLLASMDDAIGNISLVDSETIVKATVAPTVTIDALSPISLANASAYSLSGTCSSDGPVISVDIGGGTVVLSPVCSSGSWSTTGVNVSTVSDGPAVSVTADFSDGAGNPAVQATQTIEKDTVIPVLSITSAANISAANQNNYLVIGGCSEEGRAVSVNVGSQSFTPTCSSGSWSTGNFDVSAQADNPGLSITSSMTDAIGNSSGIISTTVSKETLTPTVSISSAPDINQGNVTAYSMSGDCSDNGNVVSVQLGTLSFSPNCASGLWSIVNVDVSALIDNPSIALTADHLTAAQATDTVSKDTTGPSVTISSAPNIDSGNELSYAVSGSCSENGRQVLVDLDGGALNFTLTCNSGAWSTGFVDVSSLMEGSIVINADHDNAGGTWATTAVATVSKATVSPTVSNLSVPETYPTYAELIWTLVDPGGFTINDYIINYRVKGSPTWLTFSDGVSLSKSASVTGLAPSTTYEFRVKVIYDTSFESGWSNTAEAITKPDDPIFNSPYKAMNVGGATTASVVAMEDSTAVTLNGSPLVTLNKGGVHTFTTSQFDVIDADKPIFTAGRAGSGGDTNKANMVFMPTAWAGRNFSFNATRNNPQNLNLYAIENAVVEVYSGGTLLGSTTITAGNGGVISWSVYGSYQVVSTGTILGYHYSGGAGTYVDPKPILPSSLEIIGFPSNSMRLTADLNSTNYNLWHSNSSTASGALDKTSSPQINPAVSGSLYTSSSLLISADKKISGASFADSNGSCAAPFLPTNLMKKKYMINTDSDYVAFAGKEAGTISVYSPTQTIGVDSPVNTLTLTRTGGNSNAPYSANLGTTTGGYRFVSTVPVAAWYQPNNDVGGADNDETILYGSN